MGNYEAISLRFDRGLIGAYDGSDSTGWMMSDELLAAGEAARLLGVSRQRLDELAEGGRIPRRRIGRGWIYARADLDAFKRQPKSRGGRPRESDSPEQAPTAV